MGRLLLAFQFLTIVPLPCQVECEAEDLGRSMSFFPLVGLALGALLAGVEYLAAPLLPRGVVDLLLVVALAAVTGGLHLDGLADVCDGLAARGSRQRFLEVMKDPRVGAVGAVGLVLALGLKYQALAALAPAGKREALLFFPAVARYSQVQFSVGATRARADGLGCAMVGGAGRRQLALAALVTLGAGYLLLGWAGVGVTLLVSLFTCCARRWFHLRLGGITGDAIGCVSELNEILALLLLLAAAGRGWL